MVIVSSQAVTSFLRPSLFLMALAALRRSGWVFCHFCASRRVFHDETGVTGFGEAEYGDEMPSSAPACDRGHLPSWMMTLATWLRCAICQASPKTHSKVSFCSPFHPVIFERKSRCLGHTKRGGVRHRCPDGRESTETIWNPARGRGRGGCPFSLGCASFCVPRCRAQRPVRALDVARPG